MNMEEMEKYQKDMGEYIKEDYCPHCKEHSRLLKVFDCSDRWWRCISCMGLIYTVSLPIQTMVKTRVWSDSPPSADLRAYADAIDKDNKEREEKKGTQKRWTLSE